MTFSIYALLGDRAPTITDEVLVSELKEYFRKKDDFTLEFEETIMLCWGDWRVRLCYEHGPEVEQDSAVIGRILGAIAPYDLSSIDRRIRVVFPDDDTREHTNHILFAMDFLRSIPGVIMFDPQQRDLVP